MFTDTCSPPQTDRALGLVEITPQGHGVSLEIAYASVHNFTGRVIYRAAHCLLHPAAETALRRAVTVARQSALQLHIFDAYRPPAAQQALWNFLPNPNWVADPRRGSHHSRGTALDLTLVDEASGEVLQMGTGFDTMEAASAHFHPGLPATVQRNRLLLIAIMRAGGFEPISGEWWHYQLPNSASFPLIEQAADDPLRML